MAEIVIHAEGLAQRFGPRIIFERVTFDVMQGEIFVILGGSGSGKSTLMRLLVGLNRPADGTAFVLGHDMRRASSSILSRIGVMFQSGALFGSLTLLDNVTLPLSMHTDLSRDACVAVARTKLGLVGLADAALLHPAEISGGMVKRAAIARALALDPEILFLDEPSAGLDPVTSAGLDQLIRELRDDLGTTFVVVTHELASILAIGDRALMLDHDARGVVAIGDPRALRDHAEDPRVRHFFRREAA